MSHTVRLYKNFSKRINSTKTPSNSISYTDKTFVYKQPTSIENPTLLLTSYDASYNYAKIGSKYYYIIDVRIVTANTFEVDLDIDVLATYKSEIGATSAFVEYSSSDYSVNLADPRISTGVQVNKPSTSATLFSNTSGCIVIRTVSATDLDAIVGLSSAYAINDVGAGGIVDALYSNSVLQDLSYILNNPYESIISAHWVPFTTTGTSGYVCLGRVPTGVGGIKLGTETTKSPTKYTLTLPWHNGDFRDFAPYSQWELYLPFYGTIALDPLKLQGHATMDVWVIADVLSGQVSYMIECGTLMQEFVAETAVPLPVSQTTGQRPQGIATAMAGLGAVAVGVASAFVSGGATIPMLASTIGGVTAMASGIVNSFGQSYGSKGGVGGYASGNQVIKSGATSYCRDIVLTQRQQVLSTEPSNLAPICGRPLMSVRTISSLSGYVKCASASVEINGYETEKEKVNSYVNGGFYYE